MLHRDVKSLNVFLSGPLDGQGRHTQFKLGDVGVSKVRHREPDTACCGLRREAFSCHCDACYCTCAAHQGIPLFERQTEPSQPVVLRRLLSALCLVLVGAACLMVPLTPPTQKSSLRLALPLHLHLQVLEEGKNHASTLIGTPFYLSPEICQVSPEQQAGWAKHARSTCAWLCQMVTHH